MDKVVDFPDYDCVNLSATTDENIKSIPVLIYPVINRFDLLKKSLEAIDHPIDEILIINNSQDDNNTLGLKEMFSHLNIRILNLPSNLGCSGSWNLGIKLYPHATYWMFGSADTCASPGTFKEFAAHSKNDRAVFINGVQFSLFSIGDEIVSKVGLFDEYIYPAYFEDEDYTNRFYLNGFKIHLLKNAFADTGGVSQTIKSNENFQYINDHVTHEANRDYFNSKKETGDYTPKGWELQRRRNQEWFK
jgi:GT2 family glycosyltransferase